nr:MAG TPA: hypothetical protein [Caudoviricetes sp.]DAX99995.1 MAG TPA: hypothetical protein [Caudoviricetes sp.]
MFFIERIFVYHIYQVIYHFDLNIAVPPLACGSTPHKRIVVEPYPIRILAADCLLWQKQGI